MRKVLNIFGDRLCELGNFLLNKNLLKRIFPIVLIVLFIYAYLLAWWNSEIFHSKSDLMQMLQANKILGEFDNIEKYEKLEFIDNSNIDSLTDFYNEDFRKHDNYICFYICDNYESAGKLETYLLHDKNYFYVCKHRNIVFYTNTVDMFNKYIVLIDSLL